MSLHCSRGEDQARVAVPSRTLAARDGGKAAGGCLVVGVNKEGRHRAVGLGQREGQGAAKLSGPGPP